VVTLRPCDWPVTYTGYIKTIIKSSKGRNGPTLDMTTRLVDRQRFGKLKVATWNVRGIAEKTEELQTVLLKTKIDIFIITETKNKNKGSEDICNYVMIYCGVPANQLASSGVAIAIRKDWKHKIEDYTWIWNRIIETRIKVLNRNFTIVGVYAPVEGKEQETIEFYMQLQQSMDKIPKERKTTL